MRTVNFKSPFLSAGVGAVLLCMGAAGVSPQLSSRWLGPSRAWAAGATASSVAPVGALPLAEIEGQLLHRRVPLQQLEAFSSLENDWKPYAVPAAKLYVINLWATHCTPCLEEFPKLKGLVDGWQSTPDVRFLFISDPPGDSPRQEVASFWLRHRSQLPMESPLRTTTDDLRASLGIDTQPITLLVDAQGVIRQAMVGSIKNRNLGAAIERLWRSLAEATPVTRRSNRHAAR